MKEIVPVLINRIFNLESDMIVYFHP